jgi:RHS repeat-associated protein
MANTIASRLSPDPVTWTTNGAGTISVTADVPGPNYSLSANSQTGDPNDFGGASFGVQLSGPTLTGGVYPVTTYDSGTLTVTVNGFQASAPYNQNLNASASDMATALTDALNAQGSPVTASLSGTTITLKAKGVGTATNYTVSGSSTASFTVSSTALTGGSNPSGIDAPYVTLYSYDPLDNLRGVNQKGDGSQAARVRTFTYDSLSRLVTSANPESGQISYSYDADGNMLQRTSPAPNQSPGSTATQIISYCYDALNRVTGKADSAQNCANGQLPAGTAVVTYSYDSGPNGIGHITSLTDPVGLGSYSYNVLGRVAGEQRTIAGVSKNLNYTYNLNGSMATLKYPSGAVMTYTPDAAGRTLSAVDIGNNINYATGATYGPDSSLTGFVSGNSGSFAGVTNTFSFNNRLQPVTMSAATLSATVFSVSYNFNAGKGDNGNVIGITNNRDTTRSQSFSYDQLNRLTSAQNAGTDCSQKPLNGGTKFWGNNYVYDSWGNLTQKIPTKCQSESLNAYADVQNRLHMISGADFQYDAAGNMTYNVAGPLAPQSYSYDAENRITGAAGFTYTYDADGNRVEKSNGSTGTIYWYMSPGIVAESDLTGSLTSEYVFFDGERVARKDFPSNAVSYYFSDHLKTASVITDSAGNIKEDEDYFPYGGEVKFVDNDSNHYKFTGKERDGETGLDYFGARYYGNSPGRWMSADWSEKPEAVPYADLHNPQLLNLYSYVGNRPTVMGDPNGHFQHVAALTINTVVTATATCAAAEPCGAGAVVVVIVAAPVLGMVVAASAPPIQVDGGCFDGSCYIPPPPLTTTNPGQTGTPASTTTTVETGTPETTSTTAQTGAPASTSQSGTVQTGPAQSTNQTGSYTNTHASGKTYDGKGDKTRSQVSGKRVAKENNDAHVSTDWTAAANDREAFKDESRRLDSHGGAGSANSYNKRESPGANYRKQDGTP